MKREQHITQDAAEVYAIFVMQKAAEDLDCAIVQESADRYREFIEHLNQVELSLQDFSDGDYADYKVNADRHLPAFVERIARHWPGSGFHFENVEKEYRNLGRKGDFLLTVTGREPISVSLKNYVGAGGIRRPQVGSGTFASFAHAFVFERAGAGIYLDPRDGSRFRGSTVSKRNAVLTQMDLAHLAPLLAELDECQEEVRRELLGAECEFYDEKQVQGVAIQVAERGIDATLRLLAALGEERVKRVILARSGLDGDEETLYFDRNLYVDSITNARFRELLTQLRDKETRLRASEHGQAIKLEFVNGRNVLLDIQVPYTINTNGAWYRDEPPYEGVRRIRDKGHDVDLAWGQRRPYKSREIATSTNMYVNLSATGVFEAEG